MNRKMVFYTTGKILIIEGLLMLLPLLVSIIYGESSWLSFVIAIAAALIFGTLLSIVSKPRSTVIYAKEGFAIVALAWIVMSLIGALPFVISGEIPNFADAFFETVSGLTTTGASIVTDYGKLSHGILFWRSFTHWIGGMGVLVFMMAIIPTVTDRSMHIIRAEMPGPIVGKLVPKAKETAKILYLIYIVMTAIEMIFLLCGGMPLFESAVYSFGTAGTGGLSVSAEGVGGYSPYIQWVIAIFMLLFGINFNLYYLILIKRFRSAIKSTELWFYFGIVAVASIIIGINIYSLYGNLSETIRTSVFQVSSIITTTGYATADFNLWPNLSKGIIFALIFMGGCAGSTAGGLKLSRVIILLKMIRGEIRHLLHPRSVNAIKLEGKVIDDETKSSVSTYFIMYCMCIAVTFLLISFEPFGFETNLTAAATCFNNVGPGLAGVGPTAGFSEYSVFSKLVLTFSMLLGRLEVFPVLIAMTPSTWRGKNR